MKSSTKIVLGTIAGMLALALCFAGLCFLFPEMIGMEKKSEVETAQPVFTAESIAQESSETKEITSAQPTTEEAPETSATEETQEATQESSEAPSSEAPSSEAPSSESTKESSEEKTKESTQESSQEKTKESTQESSSSQESSQPETKETEVKQTEQAKSSESSAGNSGTDKYAPVFLTVRAASIKVGTSFDVHKYVGYADDVDRDVKIETSGTVDTSKTGTYPVKITLTDDAGHSTSKTIDVKVVKSTSGGGSGGSSGGKKDEFSDFIKKYKTADTSLGIDVSKWQGNIDFEKVKAAGCEFVIIRLGGYDNGEHYTDSYYKANIANAKAAGLKVGIYWHAEESSREEVKASVDYLLGILGDNSLDFPIAYDWEDYINFEKYGMNLRDLTECFYAFADELQARGHKVCLYGSKNSHENIWQNDRKLPEWLAHYTSATSYAGDYFMWQHSSTGKIDGINGDVDLDVLYNAKLAAVMGQ
ncbi:MAG: DUF5011 domain-containing protein [Acetatifactor sp.]|nr:DUF5011 domain-containing protein [Acetatifactor sp.]